MAGRPEAGRARPGPGTLAAILATAVVLSIGCTGGEAGDGAGGAGAAQPEEPQAPPPLPWDAPAEEGPRCAPEEILVLRDLRGRAAELDRREALLAERERTAAELEAGLATKLQDLDRIRAEIVELARREQAASAQRVGQLAEMVDAMKPEEAAGMLAGMDADVALLVLRTIKPRQAGRILGEMPPDLARRLGDRMTVIPDPRAAGAATER